MDNADWLLRRWGKEIPTNPIPTVRIPKDTLRLDVNESYWFWDTSLISLLHTEITSAVIGRYPMYSRLYEALAAHTGVPQKNICIANGSDQAITYLYELLVRNGGEAIVPSPTFVVYPQFCNLLGLKKIAIPYIHENNTFRFPLQQCIAAMREHPLATVFICNPNNPLGAALDPDELNTLICTARELDMPIVVDEAYINFGGESVVSKLSELDTLVILRTFSKGFGIPGLRLGYILAHERLISTLHTLHLPWNVSGVAQEAACIALQHTEHFEEKIQETHKLREHLSASLSKLGCTVFPSTCNFVSAHHPQAQNIATVLRDEHGILVKDMTHHPDGGELLQNVLRITVPGPLDIDRVETAFTQILTTT